MRDSYRVVPASLRHISVLPSIERSAAELFGDAVPAELLEHVTHEAAFLESQRGGTLWVALGPDHDRRLRARGRGRRAGSPGGAGRPPSSWRRGVGAALLRAVEVWACSSHFSAIAPTTYRDLSWNAPLTR